ncbi:MAG TPA: adenylate/guanylate cyclase domain-containing protein, partial [Chloroflexota bacterium]|nr:adenylate/guanylate cyclase domain-containing protein [Chloroflexota bacterium]
GHIGVEGWKSEYTLLGDGVNMAARMESATKEIGAEIVISESTYERVREHVLATGPSEMTVRGFPNPVKMYAVTGLRAS